MISNREKEKDLAEALGQVLAPLGFKPDVSVPWGSVDASFWFSRTRDAIVEAVSARLRWKPEAGMIVDCVASTHSLETLARRGLELNAAGKNLFFYQFSNLDRDMDDLLPQLISLDAADSEWKDFVRSLADRIAFELASIDPGIWVELRKAL